MEYTFLLFLVALGSSVASYFVTKSSDEIFHKTLWLIWVLLFCGALFCGVISMIINADKDAVIKRLKEENQTKIQNEETAILNR